MEKDISWVRVLVDVYKHLPKAVDACNKTAEDIALSSFYYRGDAMDIMNKIISCNVRAENYINAKVLLDKAIEHLPFRYAELLSLKANTDMSIDAIADRLDFAHRSAFRWFTDALEKASAYLRLQGYGDEWFEQRFKKDLLFSRMREQIKRYSKNAPLDRADRVSLEDTVNAGLLLSKHKLQNVSFAD